VPSILRRRQHRAGNAIADTLCHRPCRRDDDHVGMHRSGVSSTNWRVAAATAAGKRLGPVADKWAARVSLIVMKAPSDCVADKLTAAYEAREE
jgi:hypothetical protein